MPGMQKRGVTHKCHRWEFSKPHLFIINQRQGEEVMNRLFTRMFGAALGLLLLSMPIAGMADHVFKQITCPTYGAIVLPPGERTEIDDIIVSANQDQVVTVKFSPADVIITKLSMKARESAVINISGKVESLEEQSLQLDCSGTGNLFITLVGSKTGM